jgi:hypothetical protein
MALYDPKDIITPDAFSVAPELLGIRLAHPGRRLAAIGIDAVFVGLIGQTSLAVLIALVAALMLWRALAHGSSPSLTRRTARVALRIMIAVFAFILVLKLWGAIRPDDDRRARPPAAVSNVADSPGIAAPTADTSEVAQLRLRSAELARRNAALEARLVEQETEASPVRGFLAEITDELGLGLGWFGFYFTVLTVLLHGQTPGKRLLGIRVIRLDGAPIGWWIAFERFGGYAASFFSGTLGFAQILWDRNRQALHDKATNTVVIRVVRGEPVRTVLSTSGLTSTGRTS